MSLIGSIPDRYERSLVLAVRVAVVVAFAAMLWYIGYAEAQAQAEGPWPETRTQPADQSSPLYMLGALAILAVPVGLLLSLARRAAVWGALLTLVGLVGLTPGTFLSAAGPVPADVVVFLVLAVPPVLATIIWFRWDRQRAVTRDRPA